ncbi:hypothetical protein D3C80_414020 [compost metagenome]
MRAVQLQVDAFVEHPFENVERRLAACDRIDQPDIPFQDADIEIFIARGDRVEKLAELVGQFVGGFPVPLPVVAIARYQVDPRVEIPADQVDRALRLCHGALGVTKEVGGVDDDRKPVCLCDLPAGLAFLQYALHLPRCPPSIDIDGRI